MPLSPPPIVDTRGFFRPISSALVTLLRGLSSEDWDRGTLAGAWTVRDVTAHLVDISLRRVSFHRDGLVPPPPPFPIENERDFVRFINGLNHEWVGATRRFSPAVLVELFDLASRDLAAFLEAHPLDAPALFGVSWAGEQSSAGWFDIAREFTELWHHQMQIRLAVGAEPLSDPKYLKAVLDVSLRVLPHAYRDLSAHEGATIAIDVTGPAGGTWTLQRDAGGWTLWSGRPERFDSRVTVSDDLAWRLLYNALPAAEASARIEIEGVSEMALPLLRARSIVI
jgi:uncharacterized protein (TIGR03083 family)